MGLLVHDLDLESTSFSVDGGIDIVGQMKVHFGSVTCAGVGLGSGVSDVDTLTLDDTQWSSDDFRIGSFGHATLNISNGTRAELTSDTGTFYVGVETGGVGVVNVSGVSPGDRTTLDLSRDGHAGATPYMAIGINGAGTMNVTDNALLRTQSASIGLFGGGTGALTLDHAGWIAFDVSVGDGGDGTLNIMNDSAFNSHGVTAGNSSGATGMITVDHSHWTSLGFRIGAGGTGNLTLRMALSSSCLPPTMRSFFIGADPVGPAP